MSCTSLCVAEQNLKVGQYFALTFTLYVHCKLRMMGPLFCSAQLLLEERSHTPKEETGSCDKNYIFDGEDGGKQHIRQSREVIGSKDSLGAKLTGRSNLAPKEAVTEQKNKPHKSVRTV